MPRAAGSQVAAPAVLAHPVQPGDRRRERNSRGGATKAAAEEQIMLRSRGEEGGAVGERLYSM